MTTYRYVLDTYLLMCIITHKSILPLKITTIDMDLLMICLRYHRLESCLLYMSHVSYIWVMSLRVMSLDNYDWYGFTHDMSAIPSVVSQTYDSNLIWIYSWYVCDTTDYYLKLGGCHMYVCRYICDEGWYIRGIQDYYGILERCYNIIMSRVSYLWVMSPIYESCL